MSMTEMMALADGVVFAAEAAIAWIYFSNLYEVRQKRSVVIGSMLLGYGLLYLANLLLEPWTGVALFFPINLLLLKLNFHSSGRTGIFHAIYLTVLMAVSDSLVNLLIAAVTGDYNAYAYRLSAFVTQAIFAKLMYFFLAVFSVGLFLSGGDKREDSRTVLLLCVVPVVSMMILTTFEVVGVSGYVTELMELLMAWSGVALLLANIVIVFIYNRMQSMYAENAALQVGLLRDKADTAYYELLQKQYDGQQILIHNIKNHLNVIALQAESGDVSGVSQYIGTMQQVPELNICTRICAHPILNMILLEYRQVCREKNIRFSADVRENILHAMEDTCVTALFSNLLSNAVEAAEKSEQRSVQVTVRQHRAQGYLFVSVVNGCDTAPTMSKGGFLTGKSNSFRHGYGTKSIDRVVKQYNGVSKLYYVQSEKQFHADIILPLD